MSHVALAVVATKGYAPEEPVRAFRLVCVAYRVVTAAAMLPD